MSDFLTRMRDASVRRVERARTQRGDAQLHAALSELPLPPPLDFHAGGFDLIAEVKRRAPSSGAFGADDDVATRAETYVLGGAAAISVLTEPDEFDGDVQDLGAASAAVPIPVMRKDFLVDPYQILEARAHGAAGALVIVRMLERREILNLVDAAADAALFLLIEVFGATDLDEAVRAIAHAQAKGTEVMIGVNTRDLTTLEVDDTRLADLAPQLPTDVRWVAESGISTPEDVERTVELGYQVALVGTSLMRSRDPAALTAKLIRAGRDAVQRTESGTFAAPRAVHKQVDP